MSGRVEIRCVQEFETENCPTCGSGLVSRCGRCGEKIFAPVADRCEMCGVPHPWAAERRAAAVRSQPRRWADQDTRDPAEHLARFPGRGDLYIVEGDVTTFTIDAVVSNDDVDGRMWAAVASSIKLAAGSEVEHESVGHGPYRLGSAWVTDAGSLPIHKVIHVAAMDRRGKRGGLDTVRKCVVAALHEAIREELDSVGLGAIGTGTALPTIPLDDWLTGVTSDIVEFFDKDRGRLLKVLIVLYEPDDFDAAVTLVSDLIPPESRVVRGASGAGN
jgi:O-acetyl-ADP-ribose deacetylase (regulator of RNase III)